MKKVMKAVAALMLMTAVVIAAGCKKNDDLGEINGGGNNGGGLNGHEYVDLGLPSGTLWAKCNVGAIYPEQPGYYFAWGEIEPKTTYEWGTYNYCNGDGKSLTKYCTRAEYGYNGFVDNLTALLPNDDAATVNWGNGWRMPTKNEWEELCQNTITSWTTQNGVNGMLFTSFNGKTIFFPAAGWKNGTTSEQVSDCGFYWSGLCSNQPNRPWNFGFDLDYFEVDNDGQRYLGASVRPVRSAN